MPDFRQTIAKFLLKMSYARGMPATKFSLGVLLSLASFFSTVEAQSTKDAVVFPSAAGTQTETDEYTRYELLAPETASFKIYYEVTATTAGAKFFYNPIRKGSVASDESVFDAMTGSRSSSPW